MQAHALEQATPPFRNRAKPAHLARREEIEPALGVSDQQPFLRGLPALGVILPDPEADPPRRFARNRFLFHRPVRKTLEQLLAERACILPYPIGPAPARARRPVKLPVIGQQAESTDVLGRPLDKDTVESILAANARPRTRAECQEGPRPCPWVSCRHHLMLEVHPTSGAIKLNHPDLSVMKETCSLDIADRDPLTLKELGEAIGVTNERVRQIEVDAGATFAAKLRTLGAR